VAHGTWQFASGSLSYMPQVGRLLDLEFKGSNEQIVWAKFSLADGGLGTHKFMTQKWSI